MPYIDGDDLHPQSNVDKMAAGYPLTDADREPWLKLIRSTAEHKAIEEENDPNFKGRAGVVIACSALKKYYRDILRGKKVASSEVVEPITTDASSDLDFLPTYFVFIKGERDELMVRMTQRTGHFMKASMLDSQLETLETPEGEDGVVVVPLHETTEGQVRKAVEWLKKVVRPL